MEYLITGIGYIFGKNMEYLITRIGYIFKNMEYLITRSWLYI